VRFDIVYFSSIHGSGEGKKLIPAVDRTLSILELLADKEEGLSFSELASSLNIPKPSLSRLLSYLKPRGYLFEK